MSSLTNVTYGFSLSGASDVATGAKEKDVSLGSGWPQEMDGSHAKTVERGHRLRIGATDRNWLQLAGKGFLPGNRQI